jgi:hypothetical protein
MSVPLPRHHMLDVKLPSGYPLVAQARLQKRARKASSPGVDPTPTLDRAKSAVGRAASNAGGWFYSRRSANVSPRK